MNQPNMAPKHMDIVKNHTLKSNNGLGVIGREILFQTGFVKLQVCRKTAKIAGKFKILTGSAFVF